MFKMWNTGHSGFVKNNPVCFLVPHNLSIRLWKMLSVHNCFPQKLTVCVKGDCSCLPPAPIWVASMHGCLHSPSSLLYFCYTLECCHLVSEVAEECKMWEAFVQEQLICFYWFGIALCKQDFKENLGGKLWLFGHNWTRIYPVTFPQEHFL